MRAASTCRPPTTKAGGRCTIGDNNEGRDCECALAATRRAARAALGWLALVYLLALIAVVTRTVFGQ